MLRSERSSLRRFLLLYWLLTLSLLVLAFTVYYRSQERIMLLEQKARMVDYASEQIKRLARLHRYFPELRTYPRDSRFRSAIYDLEYRQIFSTMQSNDVDFRKDIYRRDGVIHYVKILDKYYLGAKYLFIETPDNLHWYRQMMWKLGIAGVMAILLLALVGLYLARLFTRPMRRSIELLDRFIKDTTHELNTPLSTILTNVEGIDASSLDDRQRRKLERIEVAARTVSSLYDDLKFVTLEGKRPAREEEFDFAPLLRERLEYFEGMMRAKGIRLESSIRSAPIHADRRLLARVVDNLLSNAIKYNRRGGTIRVRLLPGKLRIEDTGRGISKVALSEIFERYSRFDESEGGFGLGLDIVRRIVDRYGFDLKIDSEEGKGTWVVLRWGNEVKGK